MVSPMVLFFQMANTKHSKRVKSTASSTRRTTLTHTEDAAWTGLLAAELKRKDAGERPPGGLTSSEVLAMRKTARMTHGKRTVADWLRAEVEAGRLTKQWGTQLKDGYLVRTLYYIPVGK